MLIKQATEAIPESHFKSLFPDAAPGASRFIGQEAGGMPRGRTEEGFIWGLFQKCRQGSDSQQEMGKNPGLKTARRRDLA